MSFPLSWKDVIDRDYPQMPPITPEDIAGIKEAVQVGEIRGDVRLATGRIWGDKEFEERRRQELEKPLP